MPDSRRQHYDGRRCAGFPAGPSGTATMSMTALGALALVLTTTLAWAPPRANAADEAAANAVWRIMNERRSYTATAFALAEQSFITNAHVIEDFVNQASKRIVLTQEGSDAELTVYYSHVALSLTYDVALFATHETVADFLELAPRNKEVFGTGHYIIGYPNGRFEVARQTHQVPHEDALSLRLPVNLELEGGFSGSPVINRHGHVVGLIHSGTSNMAAAVKHVHLHDFLAGKLQWTACRDYATPKACLEAAMRDTEREAEAGDVLAQVELGDRYRDRRDWARALPWYRRAAEQGNGFAMYRIAFFYHDGRGVPKNEGNAFRWMLRAARAGFAGAQYNVGAFFANGVGTPVNRDAAIEWFEKAAAKGDESAWDALMQLN